MVLQKGDFVRIDYIGKIKESGKVFDTTMEEIAKEHGIYDEKIDFKPAPIVVGANHVIKGLDEALVGLEVGEKKIVEIPPEKGYGKRDPAEREITHLLSKYEGCVEKTTNILQYIRRYVSDQGNGQNIRAGKKGDVQI